KLLRVLETGTIRPVGASGERRVDVRVGAATHRDLEGAVAEQRFRFDLFQRLAVFQIQLPPLRERREDIPIRAHPFLADHAAEVGPKQLSDAAMRALLEHAWSGNVRELKSALHRGAVFGGAMIEPADLFPNGRGPEAPYPTVKVEGRALRDVERAAI